VSPGPEQAQPRRNVITKTEDYTLADDECYGSVITNTGASGAVAFTLPPATVGMEILARVSVAQQLRIDPNGTETISLPSTGVVQAAGAYIVADAIGETVQIRCDVAGTWTVYGYVGTWTAV